jgi:hypothetical protein
MVTRLGKQVNTGLHIREVVLQFPACQPDAAHASINIILFTKEDDAQSLSNFSLIVCDSAPIWQRHASMSQYDRLKSCMSLAFFRAWASNDLFEPLAHVHAHSALTASIFYGSRSTSNNRQGCLMTIAKAACAERERVASQFIPTNWITV